MTLQFNKERLAVQDKVYCAKVSNFTSFKSGKPIANQFVITIENGDTIFQSYKTIIAIKTFCGKVLLDRDWNYSVTTSRYRNKFLNEITRATQKKIDDGLYLVTDLNGCMAKYN